MRATVTAMVFMMTFFSASCTGLNPQTIEGVAAIVGGADLSLRYLAGGGSLDGHAAGWESGEWDDASCVLAEQMKDLVVALVEVGIPAVVHLVNGDAFEVPEFTEPDYAARCADLEGAAP